MKIIDNNGLNAGSLQNTEGKSGRRLKKNLGPQQIRDMVTANKNKGVKGRSLEQTTLKNPRSKENQNKLRGALSDGTINFSTKERAILEKLLENRS